MPTGRTTRYMPPVYYGPSLKERFPSEPTVKEHKLLSSFNYSDLEIRLMAEYGKRIKK